MNYTGIGYLQLIKMLAGMSARKLIKMVEKDPEDRSGDKRSEYHFEIEAKGDDIGKLLVELLDYLEDETPPDPRSQPPVVILRQIMILKGLTFERPKEVKALPDLGLEVEKDIETIHVHRGWYDCPRCGSSIPTYRGLKAHITKKHPEEKEELHEQLRIKYEGRAPSL